MTHMTVVFVHGFLSHPEIWNSFIDRLKLDKDFAPEEYTFLAFPYPTEFFEWNPAKRIAKINECGNNLGAFLDVRCPSGLLILVGHSMGARELTGSVIVYLGALVPHATPFQLRPQLSSWRRNLASELDPCGICHSQDGQSICDIFLPSSLWQRRDQPHGWRWLRQACRLRLTEFSS
jgi:Alpha/beta hydrolase family